ncbi:B12-binding domain-containing radical SAM protein [Chloroflexota bacterium]
MNILLVYPQYPETFWSFKHALKFISKKAAFPPLGLLTIASLLPSGWSKRLVDMNTDNLGDEDIAWAEFVFISAMDVQRQSAQDVINRCIQLKTRTVAGGPLFTSCYDEFEGVDHFVLGEAETILPGFLSDIENGTASHIYQSDERPNLQCTPVPAWELVDTKKYATLNVQYSRGCPFDCEFCDVVLLNGRNPRTKDVQQLIGEMEEIYRLGWRRTVFMVDDNFVGNKNKLKAEVLPAIRDWMKQRHHPFRLITQASINMSDDEELMELMVEAGFETVFIGIETPNEDSLGECGKHQNKQRDLVASVKRLQNHGLEVQGGFIVGFDSDPQSIFERQISFIQQSGIVTAMVGLLGAPRGTRLYKRLKAENRLLHEMSGDNGDFSLNFVPKMNREALINGYQKILTAIYSPRQYYERIAIFLKEHKAPLRKPRRPRMNELIGFLRAMWCLGIREKGRVYYWRLITRTLFQRPQSFPLVVGLAIYGHHFRRSIQRSD